MARASFALFISVFFVCLCICLCICLYICLCICLCTCLCICVDICLDICVPPFFFPFLFFSFFFFLFFFFLWMNARVYVQIGVYVGVYGVRRCMEAHICERMCGSMDSCMCISATGSEKWRANGMLGTTRWSGGMRGSYGRQDANAHSDRAKRKQWSKGKDWPWRGRHCVRRHRHACM
jgi:hypothetical protein